MRKILIILLIAVALAILWPLAAMRIARFVDRFGTRTVGSEPIHSVAYEGSGDGGELVIDGERSFYWLGALNPHVGSTKDNQLAIAYRGKVFAFGPLRSPDSLAAEVDAGDGAFLVRKQGFVGWPESGAYGRINHTVYAELIWTKSNGPELKMTWWLDRHADEIAVHLIRVEISDASR